jgi:hypothetical protein
VRHHAADASRANYQKICHFLFFLACFAGCIAVKEFDMGELAIFSGIIDYILGQGAAFGAGMTGQMHAKRSFHPVRTAFRYCQTRAGIA